MTEDTPVVEIAPAPVIDETAARVEADFNTMQERKAEEAAIAAEQDAALAAVKAACDAERAAQLEREAAANA